MDPKPKQNPMKTTKNYFNSQVLSPDLGIEDTQLPKRGIDE